MPLKENLQSQDILDNGQWLMYSSKENDFIIYSIVHEK